MEARKERLSSLDILRGLDLFLLLVAGPVIHTFLRINSSPVWDGVRHQVSHVSWEGFVLWDIIMPLFMFMSGATIPFSMARYREWEKPGKAFLLKLLKRFCLLFFLGWIVQGNLLHFDFKLFHPFANTLQAIAVGYVFAALAFVYLGKRGSWIFGFICFAAYIVVFMVVGKMNLDPQSNVAMLVDKAVLGCHRDGVIWNPDGTWAWNEGYQYTWILSSLNFIVTVMLGCYAGTVLKDNSKAKFMRAILLALEGVSLIIFGMALGSWFPVIKKIWSSSMTLYSGGICSLALAAVYLVVDVWGKSKGLNWLKYFGMNSIAAYCIGEVINFSSVSKSLLFGLEKYTGDYYSLVITVANVTILFLIMRLMYKRGIFLKA
ncbi:MAG: DUF5009 domain-containing protein [Bacteroidales bacterium]|nr:DUF5009 domain-containing protein [Bacteroidales bacterium]